jgi:hypothetical protein
MENKTNFMTRFTLNERLKTLNFGFSITTLSIMTFSITTFSITTFNITTLSITTLSITTLSITAFSIMTLSITTFSITTFSITTFSITTFSIMTFSIRGLYVTLGISDSQHKRHSGLQCFAIMLSVTFYLLLSWMSKCWESYRPVSCYFRFSLFPFPIKRSFPFPVKKDIVSGFKVTLADTLIK